MVKDTRGTGANAEAVAMQAFLQTNDSIEALAFGDEHFDQTFATNNMPGAATGTVRALHSWCPPTIPSLSN